MKKLVSLLLTGALACGLLWSPLGQMGAMLMGTGLVILIRVLSAHYRWNLPRSQD